MLWCSFSSVGWTRCSKELQDPYPWDYSETLWTDSISRKMVWRVDHSHRAAWYFFHKISQDWPPEECWQADSGWRLLSSDVGCIHSSGQPWFLGTSCIWSPECPSLLFVFWSWCTFSPQHPKATGWQPASFILFCTVVARVTTPHYTACQDLCQVATPISKGSETTAANTNEPFQLISSLVSDWWTDFVPSWVGCDPCQTRDRHSLCRCK